MFSSKFYPNPDNLTPSLTVWMVTFCKSGPFLNPQPPALLCSPKQPTPLFAQQFPMFTFVWHLPPSHIVLCHTSPPLPLSTECHILRCLLYLITALLELHSFLDMFVLVWSVWWSVDISQWFRPVDLTNLDRFVGKKVWTEGSFFGDRYTKTGSLTKLFKDFKIKAVNVDLFNKKHVKNMVFKSLIIKTLKKWI